MTKVGITGQSGFVGTNLCQYIGKRDGMMCVPFEDAYFDDQGRLEWFVSQCDAIIHLAGVTRNSDPDFLYRTNIRLCRQVIDALKKTGDKAKVVFSSSIFEEGDTPYGRSKFEGRRMFEKWARCCGGDFLGAVFPNVFGPGSKPFYCSFIANFAYQLTHGLKPQIQVDREVKLIYVMNLCKFICEHLNDTGVRRVEVPSDFSMKVSDVLRLFEIFKDEDRVPDGLAGDPNIQNLWMTFNYFKSLR